MSSLRNYSDVLNEVNTGSPVFLTKNEKSKYAILDMMGKPNYTTEQIIVKLREVEVLRGQGKTIGEAVRQIGVSEQTYYRWRKKYGGMNISEARKYRELEKENARLKKLVADLSLDNAILKDVAEENF